MRWRIRKVRRFFWTIKRFFRNLIRWFPVLIKDEDFDFGYLLQIMHRKLEQMEKFFINGKTYSMGADRYGREIRVARILVERILRDDYSDKYFKSKNSYKHHDYLRQQDTNYLFKLMSKKLLTWWD